MMGIERMEWNGMEGIELEGIINEWNQPNGIMERNGIVRIERMESTELNNE